MSPSEVIVEQICVVSGLFLFSENATVYILSPHCWGNMNISSENLTGSFEDEFFLEIENGCFYFDKMQLGPEENESKVLHCVYFEYYVF